MTTLKIISVFGIVILAILLACLFLVVYWLIASWLVDGVMGFTGLANVLTKITLFLVILAFVRAINYMGKKD